MILPLLSSLALFLTACGSTVEDEPEPVASTPAAKTVEHKVGETAQVDQISYDDSGNDVTDKLEVTVESVKEKSWADLDKGGLISAEKDTRPYYVTLTTKNVGTEPVADFGLGYLLMALGEGDAKGTRLSVLGGDFKPCQFKGEATTELAPGKSISGCFIWLMPGKSKMTSMSYWKGAEKPQHSWLVP